MIYYLVIAISFLSFSVSEGLLKPPVKSTEDFVEGTLFAGRLGNQFFEVAAALSLALDHNVAVYFPDFRTKKADKIPLYAETIFFRLNHNNPPSKPRYTFKADEDFTFTAIPYKPKIKIIGYFQSERYFKHNWNKIRPYFEASDSIKKHLKDRYEFLIKHPFTVAIHVRDYVNENPSNANCFWTLDSSYFLKAVELFDEEALFVVFSDNMAKAKKIFANFCRPIVFIEHERDYHDLYLMSFMKHQIISNSSFSWWGAYLNNNPNKIVVAPNKWFSPHFPVKSDNIVPKSWICID